MIDILLSNAVLSAPWEAVVFRKRAPIPAISRWTTCVKTARILLCLVKLKLICGVWLASGYGYDTH